MGFSATGNLLSGSKERPGMTTFAHFNESPGSYGVQIHAKHRNLNKLGIIPVVSTFSDVFRALAGVIHSVVHLAAAIFNREDANYHIKEAGLGARNIAVGLVEMVPLLGNLIMVGYHDLCEFRDELKVRMSWEKNTFLMVVDGKVVASRQVIENREAGSLFNFNTEMKKSKKELEKEFREQNGQPLQVASTKE